LPCLSLIRDGRFRLEVTRLDKKASTEKPRQKGLDKKARQESLEKKSLNKNAGWRRGGEAACNGGAIPLSGRSTAITILQ
jgi:hypothetical protein